MIKTIVKHSYVKSHMKARPSLRGHVHYIAHRPDANNKTAKREFFTQDGRADISQVKSAIKRQPENSVLVHKLIMSPGLNTIDVQQYVRSVLGDWAYRKALDLEWYAVTHDNTGHQHAHVLVMGRDRTGRLVRFYKEDYAYLRERGDRYVERMHSLDMAIERDREELAKHTLEIKPPSDPWNNPFLRLLFGVKKDVQQQSEQLAEAPVTLGQQVQEPSPMPSQPSSASQSVEEEVLGNNQRTYKTPPKNPSQIMWWRKEGEPPIMIGPGSDSKVMMAFAEACRNGTYHLDQAHLSLLHRWIMERRIIELREEIAADKLKYIEVEYGADWRERFQPDSELKDLGRLLHEHRTGKVCLNPVEARALEQWFRSRLRDRDEGPKRDDGPRRGR